MMDKTLSKEKQDSLQENFDKSILYSQMIGNIYTGSPLPRPSLPFGKCRDFEGWR